MLQPRELGVQFLFGGEDVPFAVTNYSNVQPRILDLAGWCSCQ